jgi:hypothetical protein
MDILDSSFSNSEGDLSSLHPQIGPLPSLENLGSDSNRYLIYDGSIGGSADSISMRVNSIPILNGHTLDLDQNKSSSSINNILIAITPVKEQGAMSKLTTEANPKQRSSDSSSDIGSADEDAEYKSEDEGGADPETTPVAAALDSIAPEQTAPSVTQDEPLGVVAATDGVSTTESGMKALLVTLHPNRPSSAQLNEEAEQVKQLLDRIKEAEWIQPAKRAQSKAPKPATKVSAEIAHYDIRLKGVVNEQTNRAPSLNNKHMNPR